jgi:2-succinyl-5-enolpyruvyl-6-hydroxy-3-cyclohexene-1-carboxylate synthase
MVVQALIDQGVDTVFGYPGGAVLPIYDEIFLQNSIKHFLVRHEQGAVHAAEAYARSTGKPGVVLVTSGPGATNAVTGLTDALMDSIPLVVMHFKRPIPLASRAHAPNTIGWSKTLTLWRIRSIVPFMWPVLVGPARFWWISRRMCNLPMAPMRGQQR